MVLNIKTPRNIEFRGVQENGTRYWFRTSDPMRVKHVLYHWANRAFAVREEYIVRAGDWQGVF